ncbi:uncharacterized protein LOC128718863 [Anopheles marshallii]|uniref:uncharacterized protein LOC128718863 n=1 Tax=Anopheles marshallii TaxID=1521116 RepID=UPI00237C21FC|nr:uncharacterized protein LOC128718863 [Anopheles marshallii]
MDHRKTFPILLLLWGSLQGEGKLSPRVISLQQVMFSELQTIEKSAFITHPLHATSNANALSRLRSVFHEFERQNQESITAILRVLALVDHTLENTIQDCEKVFHLPSLDSENVLFRDVSRPLLLRVELLCQHVASGDLSEVEATMVAVEQEANSYRQRLDETKRYMQIVLHEVSNIEETSTISSKIDKIFDEIEPLNSTFRESIMAATGNLLPRQQAVCDEILEVFRDTIDEADVFEVITDFAMFLSNETELLVEDLTEQLDEWVFQTSNMINAFEEGLKNITFELIDSPIESFLQNESSLKCLAELGNHKAMHKMTQTAESMLQCFSIANDPKRPLEMVYHQLGEMADEVQLTLQDIVHCHQSTLRDDYDAKIFEDMASCFEMTQLTLEAMETFVESKMDGILLNVDTTMYYNVLKMATCFYYRARETMFAFASINHQYQTCNVAKNIEL